MLCVGVRVFYDLMFIPRLFHRELSNDHTNAGKCGREGFNLVGFTRFFGKPY